MCMHAYSTVVYIKVATLSSMILRNGLKLRNDSSIPYFVLRIEEMSRNFLFISKFIEERSLQFLYKQIYVRGTESAQVNALQRPLRAELRVGDYFAVSAK